MPAICFEEPATNEAQELSGIAARAVAALDALATRFLVERDGPRWSTQHQRVQYRSGAADSEISPDLIGLSCVENIDTQERERDDLARQILESLKFSLSPAQVEVWQYILDGYSQAEVARKLRVSEQAISQTLGKTRKRVQFHAQIVIQREAWGTGERLPMRDETKPYLPGKGRQMDLFGD
jgi:DNA-binding CsgD family transcriptional regulator